MKASLPLLLAALCAVPSFAHAQDALPEREQINQAFQEALAQPWSIAFEDPGTGNWTDRWFLDGAKARVLNDTAGMVLQAGPIPGESASHAVLWTQDSFEAPVMIQYEYTRLDQSNRGVNIIYLLATGSGEEGEPEDITLWKDAREVPTMGKYYGGMNLYHISYAAGTYPIDYQRRGDYVRARRYLPEGDTLRGTALKPDFFGSGLFREGVPHQITVINHGDWLFMRVSNPFQDRLFAWKVDAFPDVTHGRIGFRQMFTRSARYANIRISQIEQ